MPLPEGLHGAAAMMAVSHMIQRGWHEEVDANLCRKEPLWREIGDGHGTTLIATGAGLMAIGIEPVVAAAVTKLRKAKPEAADAAKPVAIRAGAKQAQIITLLQRPGGAAVSELVAKTGWQPHTVRLAISGALKKKLGLPVTSGKIAGSGRVYTLDQTV
jgi:hypothetical protein